MALTSPKGKGQLEQPNPILLSVENTLSAYTKVLGECLRCSGLLASGDFESLVSKVASDRGKISSAFTDALSFKMEASLPDGAAKVSEVSYFGFTGEAVGCMGMGADISDPMTMGLGLAAAKEMSIESKAVNSLRLS